VISLPRERTHDIRVYDNQDSRIFLGQAENLLVEAKAWPGVVYGYRSRGVGRAITPLDRFVLEDLIDPDSDHDALWVNSPQVNSSIWEPPPEGYRSPCHVANSKSRLLFAFAESVVAARRQDRSRNIRLADVDILSWLVPFQVACFAHGYTEASAFSIGIRRDATTTKAPVMLQIKSNYQGG
jgi:hypothetical protein